LVSGALGEDVPDGDEESASDGDDGDLGGFASGETTRLLQSDNNDAWIVWIHLIDLNMDGHGDIVAAPIAGAGPLFYPNNGDGAFHSLPNLLHIRSSLLFAFPDLNRDGFLDVIWTYGGCENGECPEEDFLVRALGCPTLDY
jgi:hypothetical protein